MTAAGGIDGTAYVHGLAVAGTAAARALVERGYRVVVADDAPSDAKRDAASALGLELVEAPSPAVVEALVRDSAFVVPAPGVPERHPAVLAALRWGRPLRTEIELAYLWERERAGGPRPFLAVTGTDGKTTTTLMATAMLEHAGLAAAAVGNTEMPLVAALDQPVDAFVVECTSFRLSWTEHFRPDAGAWLNLAPDHQNWHDSMETYELAKARLWAHQRPTDVAIGSIDDEVVVRHLRAAQARQVTFGRDAPDADYRMMGDELVGPGGAFAGVASMRRALPHDITDALAAAALVLETGLGEPDAIEAALGAFATPPHRIEPVAEHAGVRWYDDSKATTPHAALTAVRAFDHLVLIAGGRNKGLDLRPLASEPDRVRAVVAIGEAADDVVAVFAGVRPVHRAGSMAEAVGLASTLAVAGDAVVLSPACASFDWYPDGGYQSRGADFQRCVRELLANAPSPAGRTSPPQTSPPQKGIAS